MAFDFHKHKKGDAVRVHCCDSCARAAGVQPKYPPDSGSKSWLCEVCGHHGIGSAIDCTIGDWLRLQPNVAGNRLARQGQSELTGVLGGSLRSERNDEC